MPRRLTREEFIEKAKNIHGDKYDYSFVEYVNHNTKVKIICPVHGEFLQTPNHHLGGEGCPKCANNIKYNTEEFIKKARSIHGDKYDYSLVEYTTAHKKVKIICQEHGVFLQTPNDHLSGHGCIKCADVMKYTTEEFIKKARSIHGDKYDYSLVEYINSNTKVKIICPVHGEFSQIAMNHIQGQGCSKCYGNERLTTEEFIKKARSIHGDKYDYSLVEYVNAFTPIKIICKKHGVFLQRPNTHLTNHGCQKCSESKSEKEIDNMLINNKINFETQKRFDWLIYNSNMMLDFYLPDYNIAIECQGRQHFEIVEQFGGEKEFHTLIDRDNKKRELCEQHGIKILYYANHEYDFPYSVYTDAEKLIDDIRNNNF